MTEDPFTEPEIADVEVRRAVEIANGHIAKAEDVLWTAVHEVESNEHADVLEGVTRDIWEVQHTLMDLQRELDS